MISVDNGQYASSMNPATAISKENIKSSSYIYWYYLEIYSSFSIVNMAFWLQALLIFMFAIDLAFWGNPNEEDTYILIFEFLLSKISLGTYYGCWLD